MTILVLETPQATYGQEFFQFTSGSVTRDTTAARDPKELSSWKCDSGVGNAAAYGRVNSNTTLRVSAYFYLEHLPGSTITILSLAQSSPDTGMRVRVTSGGVLQLYDTGGTQRGSNGSTLSTGTLYRIVLSVNHRTSTTAAKVFLDSVEDISATSFTDTTYKDYAYFGWHTAPGASKVVNFSHEYVDDVSDLTDPAGSGYGLYVTAKLPGAVSNNEYDTTGGTGAVNERALSETNYMMEPDKDPVYQDYTLEDPGTGDIDLGAGQSYASGDDGEASAYGVIWQAQTFTTTGAGTVSSIWLKGYKKDTPGTLTVGVRATSGGLPTGADLTSGTVVEGSLPTTADDWVVVTVTPYALATATQYAIVARATTGTGIADSFTWRKDGSSPSYTGGQRCYSADSGSSWNADAASDFQFSVPTLATGITIIGYSAWMWAKASKDGDNFNLVHNGSDEAVAGSDGVYTMYSKAVTTAYYPGCGQGIGQGHISGVSADSYLAECGIIIAYKEATGPVVTQPYYVRTGGVPGMKIGRPGTIFGRSW